MKKLLLSVMILAFSASFAQKNEKQSCGIDHKCRLEKSYDSFEKVTTYNIGFYETNMGKDKSLTYIIRKYVNEKGNESVILTFFAQLTGCRTSDSYVHIQFKDGELLKLPTWIKDIKCGVGTISVDITSYKDKLSEKEIEKVRIYLDRDDDYIISEKGQKKFFGNINCIFKAGSST